MTHQSGLRLRVVHALRERQGGLRRLADESGISYDTVLRVKNEENDPGYSTVVKLALHLGLIDEAAADPVARATAA